MRKLFVPLLLIAAACNSGPRDTVTAAPGHGAASISVVPNPIVARHVSGDTYEFPFDIVLRETGGRPITVNRVSVSVLAPGGLSLGSESWDTERIRSLGFSTTVGPHSEVRYHFEPRRSVPDERIFGNITAELRVEAVDDTGASTSASTRVTISR